jgi:hypothetical protein
MSEDLVEIPYPNTCEDCEDRGAVAIWSHLDESEHYLEPDRARFWNHEVDRFEFRNIGWPKRCKPCNARAQAYKRAKKSVQRLEELREMVQDSFDALGNGQERWCYLKFVTLTWKNELSEDSEPDMKKARRWLQRKRDKIIEKLDCVAGTDVMECVSSKKGDLYHHHVHMHGIWIMPYHPIEYVGEIMRRYVGRDQCRAIKPILIKGEHGTYTMSAFAQARNYLMKYLTKQPGTRRSMWGFARKGLDSEKFYSRITKIYEKWSGIDPREKFVVVPGVEI